MQQIIGNYEIIREIGAGGAARVFLASHRVLGRKVALKALAPQYLHHPQLRERFLKEGKAQAQLAHRNIVEVRDFIADPAGVYMVMEYMVSGSLKDAIDRAQGPLPVPWAVVRVREALAGLDHAHRHSVVHRDVKPSNILLDADENAKVADFGIALIFGEQRLTSTGSALGTPHYMSPEQITRPKTVSHLTDVYAMGVVLYELLTGQTPFDGDSDFAIQTAHVKELPKPLRELNGALPEALEATVLRALEKRPEDRFGGCGEMMRSLEAALPSTPIVVQPPPRKLPKTVDELKTLTPPGETSRRRAPLPPTEVESVTLGGKSRPFRLPVPAIRAPQRDRFLRRYAAAEAAGTVVMISLIFLSMLILDRDMLDPDYFTDRWLFLLVLFCAATVPAACEWIILRKALVMPFDWVIVNGLCVLLLAPAFRFFESDEAGYALYGGTVFLGWLSFRTFLLKRHAKRVRYWFLATLLRLPILIVSLVITGAAMPKEVLDDEWKAIPILVCATALVGLALGFMRGLTLLWLQAPAQPAAPVRGWNVGWSMLGLLAFLTALAGILPAETFSP